MRVIETLYLKQKIQMKKVYTVVCLLMLMSCKNVKQNSEARIETDKIPSVIVGGDKDEHGCIGSAGYTWSEIKNECIRIWELGIRLEMLENKEQSAYVVFNKDKSKVEVYFSNKKGSLILPLNGENYESEQYSYNANDQAISIKGVVKYR